MAWTSTIVGKKIQDKALIVSVSYDDGLGHQFVETMDVTGATLSSFSGQVNSRLATLTAVSTLWPQVTLGSFTPAAAVATASDTFLSALRHYNSCARAVSLGLILDTDPLYTGAQAALTSAWDPAFIDLL